MGRHVSFIPFVSSLAAAALLLAGVAGATAHTGNGKIALMSVRDGRAQIDVIGADGSASASLTGSGLNAEPAWSHDGTRLAYVCGNFSLCLMNADGSGQRALTDTGAWSGTYVYDEYPSWSPDGRRLAFQSNRSGLDYGIWLIGSDGRGLHRLAGNASGNGDYSPTWSPDGSRIAFESDTGDNYDLYLMYPDGTLAARLTHTDDDEGSPSWSPDGQKIVYTRWRGDFSKLWLMNADGSGQHALTTGATDEYNPSFSPDGTKILFTSDRGGNYDLYTLNADGSGPPTRLTSNAAAEINPTWQPIGAIGDPPLPASTAPAPGGDAPLVGEIFSREVELEAVQQAIFEARAHHKAAAQRAAYTRLLTSAARTARSLSGEQPTSAKGKRLQRLVVTAWRQLALEGRERIRALDAARRGNRRAQKQHQRAGDRADSRAHDLFDSASNLIG